MFGLGIFFSSGVFMTEKDKEIFLKHLKSQGYSEVRALAEWNTMLEDRKKVEEKQVNAAGILRDAFASPDTICCSGICSGEQDRLTRVLQSYNGAYLSGVNYVK